MLLGNFEVRVLLQTVRSQLSTTHRVQTKSRKKTRENHGSLSGEKYSSDDVNARHLAAVEKRYIPNDNTEDRSVCIGALSVGNSGSWT